MRPIAVSEFHGIHTQGIIVIDTRDDYLLEIDRITHNTKIINLHHWKDFIRVTGIASANNTFWLTSGQTVYYCSLSKGYFSLPPNCLFN